MCLFNIAMNADIIKTDIIMFVQTLLYVNKGIYSAWDTRTIDFSDFDNVDGFLTINNPKISLTMGPFDLYAFATVEEDDDGNFLACVNNVTFPDFNVTFDYTADFGINNDIPIYGAGSYKGRLTDIMTTFCWLVSLTTNEILEFDIKVDFRHQPASLTGVYENNELDPILGNLLTLAKRLFAMWNNYEPECSSKCVLNPVFLFMTNYFIYNAHKNDQFTLDGCSCLKEIIKAFHSEMWLGEDKGNNLNDTFNVLNYCVEALLDDNLQLKLETVFS